MDNFIEDSRESNVESTNEILNIEYEGIKEPTVQGFVGEDWSNDIQVYLLNISKKCKIFRNIHEESAIYYETRFRWFSIFLVIVPFTQSIVAVTIITFYNNDYYKYFVSILSTCTTTLAIINSCLKWQEYATKHRIGSQKFLELNMYITEELLTLESKRMNGVSCIKWAGKTFCLVRKALPYPPISILKRLNVKDDDPDIYMSKETESDVETPPIETPRSVNALEEFKQKKFNQQLANFST